jgi:tetrahydromethanopterin S-methyltransferase subunit C
MKGIAASTIAGCFALSAFTVAIVAGLASGNPALSVLWRAIVALLVCYPLGFAVGMVAQHLVQQHIDAHRRAHPEAPNQRDAAETASNLDEHGNPTDEEVLVM